MRSCRQRRSIARLLGLLLLIQLFPAISRAEYSPTLMIGEVNWAGSSRSSADEWMEIWNVSDEPIALNGYRLIGAGGMNDLVFSDGHIILPHQSFLIANYAASDTKSSLEAVPNIVTSTLSLPNDRLTLELRAPDGALVDQVGSNAAPVAGSTTPQKSSMIRVSGQRATGAVDEWESATSSVGMDMDVDDLGTPGWCDHCMLSQLLPTSMSIEPTMTDTIMETTSTADIPYTTSTIDASLPNASHIPTVEQLIIATTTEAVASSTTVITSEDTIMATTTKQDPLSDRTTTSDATSSTATSITATSSVLFTSSASEAFSLATPFTPRLNEVMAAPVESSEWIELMGVERDDLSRLEGWTIEDAIGTIFRFTSTTIRDLTLAAPYLQIILPGRHLNNAGDYVGLRNPNQIIVDHTTYPRISSDESWIRLPDASEMWRITRRITPANENVLFTGTVIEPYVVSNTPSMPVQSMASISTMITNEKTTNASALRIIPTYAPPHLTKPAVTRMRTEHAATSISPISPTSTMPVVIQHVSGSSPVRAVAARSLSPSPAPRVSTPLKPMPTSSKSNAADTARARLIGTVASVAGLLGKNQFVLLADDGRGLLVKGNGQQTTPPYQQRIAVMGALVANDEGIALTMAKRDRWTPVISRAGTSIPSRNVRLLAPSTEDAWSLMEVTGTVREIRKPYVIIETEDLSIGIHVRPAIRYRIERLQTGDLIQVRGLLEPGTEEPRILPRNADEIRLLERAPVQTAQHRPFDSLPPWTPFGAAGLTIALTQGIRRMKKIQKQRHLKKVLEQAESHLTSST